MIYVLSTCTIVMGKRNEFENTMKEIISLYEKHGGRLVGFWWQIAGEKNEALWLFSWKDTKDWEKGEEETWNDKNFPMEKVASTVITYSDKILKPAAMSPMK